MNMNPRFSPNRDHTALSRAGLSALLLCLVITIAGCGDDELPHAELPQVLYLAIEEERVTLTSELPGRISALVTAEVRPQVDGIIHERLFEEGSDVVKGQVLYQIDPSPYQAAHSTAKATLEEAEETVVALRLLEDRYRNLVKAKAVSRQELDNAIADHGRARARIARAKAELETAAINLAYTQIKAPVSGRIGRSSVTQGALVTANQPEALAVIQQTERVYVDSTQSSVDMIRLRRAMVQGGASTGGNPAKARLLLEDGSPYALSASPSLPDTPEWILGDLLFSEISVGQTTGSVALRAVFDNPEGLLLPGMYVRMIIEESTLENALLVPQGSVIADGSGGHYVLVIEKSGESEPDALFTVARKEVTLGRAKGNRWVVASGLSAGDNVMVAGLQKAAPGDTVNAIQATREDASVALGQSIGKMR